MSATVLPLGGLLLELAGLFGLPWVGIFGGIGALLSRSRGYGMAEGFVFGLLGPIGWAVIWLRTMEAEGFEKLDLGDGGWGAL